MRLLTAACVAALVGAAAAPAFAQDDYETRRQTVYYGDLDPYDRKDAGVLLDRIERASDDVCDDRMPRAPSEAQDEAICESIATEEAVHDTGNSVLLATHLGLDPSITVEDEGAADPYKK